MAEPTLKIRVTFPVVKWFQHHKETAKDIVGNKGIVLDSKWGRTPEEWERTDKGWIGPNGLRCLLRDRPDVAAGLRAEIQMHHDDRLMYEALKARKEPIPPTEQLLLDIIERMLR